MFMKDFRFSNHLFCNFPGSLVSSSYKSCTHSHSFTPSQKGSHPPTPTHTQPKNGHTHPYPPTPIQKKTIPIHTYPHSAKKRSYPATPTKTQLIKGDTHQNQSVNLQKRKFFIIYQLIKFIRNSGSPKYSFRK